MSDLETRLMLGIKRRLGADFILSKDETAEAIKLFSRCVRPLSADALLVRSIIGGFTYELSADDQLREDAMKYADYQMHLCWSVQSPEFRSLMDEPDAGCRDCKGAFDAWMGKQGAVKRVEPPRLPDLFDKERLGIRAVSLQGWRRGDTV